MSKKLILGTTLLLVVSIVTVLFQDGDPGGGPTLDAAPAGSVGESSVGDGANLVGLRGAGNGQGDRVAGAEARAKSWLVVIEGGEPGEPELAHCKATLLVDASGAPVDGDPPVLEATGQAQWDAPPAGTWELSVDVQGREKVRRQVVLPALRSTRTVVNLDARIRIDGLVRDVLGKPCANYFVGFVPRGGRAPLSARDWLDQPHARCDVRGRFTIELPQSGTYRPFAGYGGKVLVEDTSATKLLDTPSRFVTLTAPVPTRLAIVAKEERGDLLPTGYAVSVYRRREIMDMERPLPPKPVAQPIPDPDDPSLDADQRTELLAELEAMKVEVDHEALERRRSVVPKGWRLDRTGVLSVQGVLQLTGLPAGEELRFAATRGGEPFFVRGSAVVDPLLPTEVVIVFPPELPDGTPPPAEARSASVETRLGDGAPVVASVGVVWR